MHILSLLSVRSTNLFEYLSRGVYRKVLLGGVVLLGWAEVVVGEEVEFTAADPADWQVWSVCAVVLGIFGAFCLAAILRARRAIQLCDEKVAAAQQQGNRSDTLDADGDFHHQFQGIIDSIDIGLAVVDKDFIIQHANVALLKIFDISETSAKEVKNSSCRDLFCKISPLGCANCPAEQTLSTLQNTEDLLDSAAPDGRKIVIRRRTRPLKNKNGKPTGFVLLVDDVSQQYLDD